MIAQPILTILIPTFNRAELLAETLQMFFHHIKRAQLFSDIRIIIGDNASEDSTPIVIKEQQSLFKAHGIAFTYYRNERNIGLTRSLLKGLEQVDSTYTWIFGDDDLINEELLIKIVKILQQKVYAHLVIPIIAFQQKAEIAALLESPDYSIHIESETINHSNFNFFDRHYGFLGSIIISTAMAQEGSKFLLSYPLSPDNNYFMKALNYYCHFTIPKNEQAVLNCPPLVYQRITEGSYFSQSAEIIEKTFFYDNFEVADFITSIHPERWFRSMVDRKYFVSLNKLNLLIIKLKSERPNHALFGILKRVKKLNVFIILLLLIPRQVVNQLYSLYKKIKRSPGHPIFTLPLQKKAK